MKKLLLAGAAVAALSSGAQAADLGVPRTPIAAAVIAPVFSWTGFYAGLNVGLGIANTNLAALAPVPGYPGSGSGLVAGAQIGYNYQINNFVIGAEADIGYFGVSRRQTILGIDTSWRTTWDASIRGRAGVAVDRALFYVTGGVAFADFSLRQVGGVGVVIDARASQTRVGWTVGAGIEYAVTQNWTVRGEYLYANYGSKSLVANGIATPPISLQEHKIRVGVNYLFSTGPSAIVARY
jgi:outer membrane immunogenic protein